MINQIEYHYNLIACYEDKALDWKAANVYAYWNKVFHLEMDLGDILIPLASLVANVAEMEVER